MADLGTIGRRTLPPRIARVPASPQSRGQGQVTGTARVNEINAPTDIQVLDLYLRPLYRAQAAGDGSFALYNLAPGRCVVLIDGQGVYLPGIFVVDIT